MENDYIKYRDALKFLPNISSFLANKKIGEVTRLDSIWRKENLILRLSGENETYVLKVISENGEKEELDRIKLMKEYYPKLFTDVFVYENNSYLMSYVPGKNFFELEEKDRLEKVALCGKRLREEWSIYGVKRETKDIREEIKGSFIKYRSKRAKFFSEDELLSTDFEKFSRVPFLPSHNDLNCANVLYNGCVTLIDPSSEGYEDTARDVGRYFASVFFNNYDRYGNNKIASLDIAEAFLSPFDDETLHRARYYIGESFLSFLNFPTITAPKEILKKLTMNVLASDRPLTDCLERSL